MALGTGQLSLGDIAGEYGGSAPHAISEYYSKGNAPSSGEIQIHADFNGTSNVFTFAITGNASNQNLRTLAVNAGWDASSPVIATLNSGVTISSSSSGGDALVIDGSWANGVTFINNGTVLGRGGNGGTAGAYTGAGAAGAAGGDAVYAASAVSIDNNGSFIGGGGGGGGSGGYAASWGGNITGCGGGGGAPSGTGGAKTSNHGNGSAGANASGSSGGAGGTSGSPWNMVAGNGGGYGAAGGGGNQSSLCGSGCGGGGAGGAAGYAVRGNSYVTWDSTGTRTGTVG